MTDLLLHEKRVVAVLDQVRDVRMARRMWAQSRASLKTFNYLEGIQDGGRHLVKASTADVRQKPWYVASPSLALAASEPGIR